MQFESDEAVTGSDHRYTIVEPSRIPLEGYILGYGPVTLMALGAAASWLLAGDLRAAALRLTLDWAIAILLFLSGVRRGLSFRSPRGPTMPQRVTFFWLFTLGLAGLLLPQSRYAAALVALGFASIGICDWRAARKGEAPPYFARLRPPQMAIATISMLAILALDGVVTHVPH